VGPALVLEDRVGAVALDGERDLLETADLGGRLRQDLVTESELVGVAGEHLVEVSREQAGLVPAGTGADLHDHVLVVMRIALDHRETDLLAELLEARGRLGDERPQLGILAVLGQELARALQVARKRAVLGREGMRLPEIAVRAADLRIALAVGDHLGVGHLPLELGMTLLDLLDEPLDHGSKCDAVDGGGGAVAVARRSASTAAG
jgi:hypothetical protein